MKRVVAGKIADLALASLLVLAPLAFGTVHLVSTTLLATLSVVLAVAHRVEGGAQVFSSPRVALVAWVLLVSVAYSLFQLVPLPTVLLEALSPSAMDLRTLGGIPPRFAPIAVESADASLSVVRRSTCALVFLVVAERYGRPHSGRLPLVIISLTGGIVAVVGLVSLWLGDQGIWGMPIPRKEESDLLRGTFINRNHAAAYLSVTGITATLLAARLKNPGHRVAFGFVAVLSSIAVLFTRSRGGIGSFFVTLALLGSFLLLRGLVRSADRTRSRLLAAALWTCSCAAIVVGFAYSDERFAAYDRLDDMRSDTKLRLQRESVSLIRDFARAGAGHDSFGSLHGLYRQVNAPFTFSHIENSYLQQLADSGVVFGSIPVLVIIAAAFAAFRGDRGRTRIYLVAALLAIGLHELVDFSLETGAISITFFVLLAVLLARRPSSRGTRSDASPRLMTAVACAMVIVASCTAITVRATTKDGDTALIRGTFKSANAKEVETVAHLAASRHPADYFIPLMMAEYHLDAARPEIGLAMRWTNRALFLAPNLPGPHRAAGRLLLLTQNPQQGVSEFATAYRLTPHRKRGALIQEVWRLRPSTADVAEIVGASVPDLSLAADVLEGEGAADPAAVLADRILGSDRDHVSSLLKVASWHLRKGDAARAADLVERSLRIDERNTAGRLLKFEVLRALGRPDAARAFLEGELARDRTNAPIIFRLTEEAIAREDYEQARSHLMTLPDVAPDQTRVLARAQLIAGLTYERQSMLREAVLAYERARSLDRVYHDEATRSITRVQRLRGIESQER